MPKKCETPCLKLGQETLAIMIAVSVLKVLVPMGNENSDPQLGARFEFNVKKPLSGAQNA
jgi:hypothetical protein